MNKILEINNVTKYYGSGSVVTKALNGISLSDEKGEFTAIMGASAETIWDLSFRDIICWIH